MLHQFTARAIVLLFALAFLAACTPAASPTPLPAQTATALPTATVTATGTPSPTTTPSPTIAGATATATATQTKTQTPTPEKLATPSLSAVEATVDKLFNSSVVNFTETERKVIIPMVIKVLKDAPYDVTTDEIEALIKKESGKSFRDLE